MLAPWMPRLIVTWRRLRLSTERGPELTSAERGDVVAGAQRLSRGLTGDRDLAGTSYFEDPQLLGAYLLLYWPRSYAQAASVLREVGAVGGRVLDVGSGPAPLAFAAVDAGATRALAIDRSAPALAVARALAEGADAPVETARWDPTRPLPDGPFDLVLAGHLLNELHSGDIAARVALVETMLARLRPTGFVVLVEPALRETSRALLSLRDRLVAAGATVRAPCLYRGNCPALVRPSDWCHAERAWTPPPLVDELARAARLHRDALKMSYLVLQAPGAPWPRLAEGRLFRIVSEPLPRKGQLRYVGCGPEGRHPLVLAAKHVHARNLVFSTLARGDLVRVERLTARGDGLRLEEDSVVERLAAADDPLPTE